MPMLSVSLLWQWEMQPLQVSQISHFFTNALYRLNCSISCLAFNRTRIASEGAVPVLIEFMRNGENDIVARQYCAMALGNLAAEPENHMEIVKSEGIDALIAVLKSEDVEGGRYAAFALSNLAANANHRERIVEENAVPALVALACSEDINAQRQGKYLSCLPFLCWRPIQ